MITASVVTYNTSKKDLDRLRESFAMIQIEFVLYVVDNSPTDKLCKYFKQIRNAVYIHNPSNPGFGAAHNIGIKEAEKLGSTFHYVINPDVYFDSDVFTPMLEYMYLNEGVGMMMPQILNLDGSVQNLPKLLPSPVDLLVRKIKKPTNYYNSFIKRYELRFVGKDVVYEAPILSGCFTLFRMSAIKEIGMYDDRFFMYFEDWDLSRRMHSKYKTVYYPKVSVYHGYESGANKNSRLFKIFVNSAIAYFNKWGWFSDKERSIINKRTLDQFNK